MESVRQTADRSPVGTPDQAPSIPFSLMITGTFPDTDKEKLLEILSKNSFGIRGADLEPQFEAGKVLIPRISEYAGVMIVQALRDAPLEMTLAPADTVYSTPDTIWDYWGVSSCHVNSVRSEWWCSLSARHFQ